MIIGIDEVGRGCWAGPLVIGAVSLNKPILGLKDSKKLSIIKRQELSKEIYLQAKITSLGWVWPHEIDLLGLTKATTLAIKRALMQIDQQIDEIIIDGNVNYLKDNQKARTLIKADTIIPSVSAASILAKVARDNYMHYISQFFPSYGFNEHVGYGTSKHRKALVKCGPCAIHRLTFRPLREKTFNIN